MLVFAIRLGEIYKLSFLQDLFSIVKLEERKMLIVITASSSSIKIHFKKTSTPPPIPQSRYDLESTNLTKGVGFSY